MTGERRLSETLHGAPPEALFAVGAVSQYAGAAIAVALFDHIAAAGVAWLRVLGADAILVAWRRPWRHRFARVELAWIVAFGSALAIMNLAFYLAIDELPLGNAVAIEFLGPIAVAAFGSRSRRAAFTLALAVGGVLLIAEVQPEGSARGVAFALLAGTAWAGYILLGHRVARFHAQQEALAVGMVAGAAVIAVFGVPELGPALDQPTLLLLALATGLFSNVLPYGIDQVVMRKIDRYRFAVLQAMLPATAVLVGVVALGQVPSWAELLGVAAVATALALSDRRTPIPEVVTG